MVARMDGPRIAIAGDTRISIPDGTLAISEGAARELFRETLTETKVIAFLPMEERVGCVDKKRAAKSIPRRSGIESGDVANYCFPKTWPANREQRARWRTGARFLA